MPTSERTKRRIRVTPGLVISLIALFAALSTTSYAKSIPALARRALVADKAKTANIANTAKVATLAKTATHAASADTAASAGDAQTLTGQTAAQIAATPGPTSSLSASLFTYRTDSFEVDKEGQVVRVDANCQSGEKVVGGGWDITDGAAAVLQDSPKQDGSGWRFVIWGESGNDLAAVGLVYAVCAKVS